MKKMKLLFSIFLTKFNMEGKINKHVYFTPIVTTDDHESTINKECRRQGQINNAK